MNNTIYVAMPTLRDYESFYTIGRCFEAAKNPENIFLGVAYYDEYDHLKLQDFINDLDFKNNINIKFYNIQERPGVGNGRNDAKQFYSNQEYFLQIDSHTNFDKNWDKKILKAYKKTTKKYGKNVLTACLPRYKRSQDKPEKLDDIARYGTYRGFQNNDPDKKDYHVPDIGDFFFKESKKFDYAIKVSACMIFGKAEYLIKETIPRETFFFEEEIFQSINLFGDGINLIFYRDVPMQHLDWFDSTSMSKRWLVNDYFSDEEMNKFYAESNKNQKKFLDENIEKVKMYEEYAHISFEKRTLDHQEFVPLFGHKKK